MNRNGIKRFKLDKGDLAQHFPILFLCSVTDLDVGFPKKRKKLVFPPQDNLDYVKEVRR